MSMPAWELRNWPIDFGLYSARDQLAVYDMPQMELRSWVLDVEYPGTLAHLICSSTSGRHCYTYRKTFIAQLVEPSSKAPLNLHYIQDASSTKS